MNLLPQRGRVSFADCLESTRLLLGQLPSLPAGERWSLPFPLGVFGTLRAGLVNNRLMHKGRIAAHRRAFLPNFVARSIDIHFQEGASAPFEIFFYEPHSWRRVIRRVDQLESFEPNTRAAAGYQRSLAWLRLLPETFDHPHYHPEMLGEERDLTIDAARWADYEQVPCWIYSSVAENRRATESGKSPIIWDGMS